MRKPKLPWPHLKKKSAPEPPLEPPIWLGNVSNGEVFYPQSARDRRLKKEILKRADDQARYVGMDRRDFLASSMGLAVTLSVFNQACESETKGGTGTGGKYGIKGPYVVPQGATCDPSAYIPASDRFIFDVQTHAFDAGEWRDKQFAYPYFLRLIQGIFNSSCTGRTESLDCYKQDFYAETFFVNSKTTMTVITSWPAATCLPERDLLGYGGAACALPLSNQGMKELRDWINERALSQRVINQVQVMPNDFIEHQVAGMRAAMEDPTWRCGSWKMYPAWTSDTYRDGTSNTKGFFLTDPIGRRIIEEGLKLGVPNFAVHKGLPIPGFDVEHNKPTDVGTVARDYQMANFVIYHSAITAGRGGGVTDSFAPPPTENVPYAQTGEVFGVNMLIRDLIEKGLIDDPDAPGTKDPSLKLNVYAEMGTAWSRVMTDPVSSQHYIGKLMKYLGADNMIWGTDSLVALNPAQQIAAFEAFQTDPAVAAANGYPTITEADKDKIMGLNAAKLYRVDPTSARCAADQSTFAQLQRDLDDEYGGLRWAGAPPLGPATEEEFWDHARKARARGVPG